MERGDSSKLRSAGKLRIPKPTRHAFINFVQDFRQSYKGMPRTAPQMVTLAAQAWRSMGERERAPFVAVAAEERLKPRAPPTRRRRVDRLRSQLRLLKEQLAGLKSTAKQLQAQSRRRRALRQRRVPKRAAPKSTAARRGSNRKPKRAVKKTRRAARRPQHSRRQPSYTSVSSCCSSS